METILKHDQLCFPLDSLPHHVQINILGWLSVADLNSVCLLNSYYYNLVTKNSSLNSKICLAITREKLQKPKAGKLSVILNNRILKKKSKCDIILESERKFVNIKLKRSQIYEYEEISSPETEASAINIFRKHNATIKWFQVTKEYISLHFFGLLLHQLPHLECVEFLADSIEPPFFFREPPLLNNLKVLKAQAICNRDVEDFLKVFEKINSLEVISLVEVLLPLYSNFLQKQSKLIELEVIGSFEGFLKENIKVPFNLKKLVYVGYSSNSINSLSKLSGFLNNQTRIESLKLSGFPFYNKIFIQTLLSMPNLKYLDLNLRDGLSTSIMLNIKNIVGVGLNNLVVSKKRVEYFPNLRCFELTFKDESKKYLSQFSKLKEVNLTVNNEYYQLLLANGFKTANLKIFKATVESGSVEEWQTFFENNSSIISVELEYYLGDEVLEVLTRNLQQLETFICQDLLDQNAISILMNNCNNLKTLNLYLKGKETTTFSNIFQKFEEKLNAIDRVFHFTLNN